MDVAGHRWTPAAETRSRPCPRRGSINDCDRRLDPVEHRLGVDAGEHDDAEERQQHRCLLEPSARGTSCSPRRARRGTPAGRPTAGRARRGSRRSPRSTTYQRADRNEPIRIRYSPTKPFRPGTPIELSMTTMKPAAKIGATDWMPVQLADLAGVAALVDPADHEEQRTGRDAVVDHLHDGAGDRLGRERERAEHDEAEVGDRRVGDEPLEVASASWRRWRRR